MPTRKPRFRRDPGESALKITNRDLLILRHLWRHRFLNSDQVVRLIGGSHQGILRRLNALYHHGYLGRPEAQKNFFERQLNPPLVYELTGKGKRMLAHAGRISSEAAKLRDQRTTRLFLEHELAVAEFMVRVETECPASYRVLSAESLMPPGSVPSREIQWIVQIPDLAGFRELTVIPDAVFGIQSDCNPNDQIVYLVEIDRGTMPVRRRNFRQSSFRRKLIAYHETWRSGILREQFGWNRWRVLTVTSSIKRMENLIEEARTVTQERGAGLFLFSDTVDLDRSESLFQMEWHPARGGKGEVLG